MIDVMKRIAPVLLLAIVLFGMSATVAQATSIPNPAGEGESLTLAGIVIFVTDVINALLALAMIITVAMIVYAGFRMATAGDNTKQFGEGKTSLTHAIIGLVVILGVGIIVRTIGNFAVSPTSILR